MKSKTWILLRGLAREKGHWGSFTERMQSAFPDDEILPLDLPGTGEFRNQASPASMNEIFRFVRAKAVERTRGHSTFHLMAISLGGMVAMEWMRERPEDLGGAVLINTSLSSLSPMYNRLRWQIWPQFLRLASTQSAREREKGIVDLLINSEEGRASALPLWSKLAVEHPIPYLTFFNQLMAAGRFRGLQEKPNLPVYILNSLGDRLVDPSCSTALHQKMNWPLERHPWAGHDLPWDDATWVLTKVTQWMDGGKVRFNAPNV